MADALTTITTFINSPPGQIAAGGVLAGIVWKFFERVESVLPDGTKFEIAVWMVGVETSRLTSPWAEKLAWTPFALMLRFRISQIMFVSLLWTIGVWLNIWTAQVNFDPVLQELWLVQALPFLFSAYICFSVLTAALTLSISLTMRLLQSQNVFSDMLYAVGCTAFSITPAFVITLMSSDLTLRNYVSASLRLLVKVPVLGLPGFVLLSFMCFYPLSILVLKAARRFDIGFQWFNRKFDIEKKPLSAIGLVAGALVAVLYWAAVIVGRLV
jgi:hypothetical protein